MGEVANVVKLREVLVDGVELNDLLTLDRELRVDPTRELGNPGHRLRKRLHLLVDLGDIHLHLFHSVNGGDELAPIQVPITYSFRRLKIRSPGPGP